MKQMMTLMPLIAATVLTSGTALAQFQPAAATGQCQSCQNGGGWDYSGNGSVATYADCWECQPGSCPDGSCEGSCWDKFCLNWCGGADSNCKLARCYATRGAGDSGWNPPARLPVNRDGIWYQNYWPQEWYGNPGGGFVGQYPTVYQPTDTTQLGFYYAKVPTWRPNPGMIPQAPCPAHYHARVCPPDNARRYLGNPCQPGYGVVGDAYTPVHPHPTELPFPHFDPNFVQSAQPMMAPQQAPAGMLAQGPPVRTVSQSQPSMSAQSIPTQAHTAAPQQHSKPAASGVRNWFRNVSLSAADLFD